MGSFAAAGFHRLPLRATPSPNSCGFHDADLGMSQKWRMLVSYDGTDFAGWQYQQAPPTVQFLLEKALLRFTNLDRKQISLVGAGRTDAGVHASGQVAHFVTPFVYDNLESLHSAVNAFLPPEIRVREISPANTNFHARLSAKSKLYRYKIYNHSVMDPLQCRYTYHSIYKLNPVRMKKAARYFVGKHDFSSFANASSDERSPDPHKEVFRFDVDDVAPILQLDVEGSGFLFRQVRNMVALLIQIGKEALPPEIVTKILAAKDRRELAKFASSAPPHGLCLISVDYDDEILKPPVSFPAISYGRERRVSKCIVP